MKRICLLLYLGLVIVLAACNSTAVSTVPVVQELEVPAGDVTLSVRTVWKVDSGDVLIAVNGGPGLTSNYMRSLEALAGPELAVVTYDQRGNGRSTKPEMVPANFELADYATDVEAIRAALGVEQVHVLGHSFGGLVAMEYAVRYPERVQSLILLGSGPPTWDAIQDAFVSFSQRVAVLQDDGLLPEELGDNLDAILPAYFSNPAFVFATDDPGGAPEEDTAVNELTWQAIAGYDLTADLADLHVPVLILYGVDDPFGLGMAEASRDALLNADVTYVLLPHCGHFWHECPEAAFGEIQSFLGSSIH
ncbi:MAG: alpha/beta hydrolase [Ardenticatenaceae bacterium]|nr:alpha/beta hydrolase [Ardenticatenaceae bacterium]MCB9446418.1 alpha/beta hydrolase [Ardenticatenaceae bacterium]